MTLETIAVNGVPIETYGVKPLDDLSGWFVPPRVRHGAAQLVGRVGPVASGRGMLYEPRTIGIGIMTLGDTLAASLAQLDAWHRATRGLLELELIDRPGRVIYGLYEEASDKLEGVTFEDTAYQSIGTIVCHNPLYYTRVPRIVGPAVAGERLTVPVGTAAGPWRAFVLGAATTPTITARSHTGAAIATLRMTRSAPGALSLLSTDYLDLDPSLGMGAGFTKLTSGVASSVVNYLHLSDTFFGIDPLDGVTLETNQGTLLVYAREAYLS